MVSELVYARDHVALDGDQADLAGGLVHQVYLGGDTKKGGGKGVENVSRNIM